MSEDPQPGAGPDAPVSPDTPVGSEIPVSSEMPGGSEMPVSPDTPVSPVGPGPGQDVELSKGTQLRDRVASHLADQARLTAQGYRARRVTTEGDQPGMTDLTPLRELLAELMEEARRMKLRERMGRALRQAADIIDPPSG